MSSIVREEILVSILYSTWLKKHQLFAAVWSEEKLKNEASFS